MFNDPGVPAVSWHAVIVKLCSGVRRHHIMALLLFGACALSGLLAFRALLPWNDDIWAVRSGFPAGIAADGRFLFFVFFAVAVLPFCLALLLRNRSGLASVSSGGCILAFAAMALWTAAVTGEGRDAEHFFSRISVPLLPLGALLLLRHRSRSSPILKAVLGSSFGIMTLWTLLVRPVGSIGFYYIAGFPWHWYEWSDEGGREYLNRWLLGADLAAGLLIVSVAVFFFERYRRLRGSGGAAGDGSGSV